MDAASDDPRLGTILDGRYKVLSRIAQGSMGVVYRAERLRLGRSVAVKFLHGSFAADPQFVGRFDSKLDRTTNTLVILGLWLENKALGKDEAFAEALTRGFSRFVQFLGATKLNAKAIREPMLRRRISAG